VNVARHDVGSRGLLSYEHATVGYSREPVVCDATLDVAEGEVVGLVGPNGAGKSTLLRAVTGNAELLAGALNIGGTPAGVMAPLERARCVGVVPQQTTPAFSLPAREFVLMGRHPRMSRFSEPREGDLAVVERAMQLTDTERLADKPTDALSGGDLQRLALAQALAQEPRVLLLDEPVSHLDLNHTLQILDLTRALAAKGMAVLAVFHDLDLASRYADRIAVVADGHLGACGTPEQIVTSELLRNVFGVRAVVGPDLITGAVSVTPVLREQAVAGRSRGRVLVIGGSGVAAPLMRRLVAAGWGVSAGALNAGDADQLVADALGIEYASLPPFAPMDDGARKHLRSYAESADAVVVCEVPFGHGNVGNLAAAVGSSTPLVLVGTIAGRDYTGGVAERLWAEALARGARVVADLDAAEHELSGLVADAPNT
jgi:iron complex transport system ATP-binding protein